MNLFQYCLSMLCSLGNKNSLVEINWLSDLVSSGRSLREEDIEAPLTDGIKSLFGENLELMSVCSRNCRKLFFTIEFYQRDPDVFLKWTDITSRFPPQTFFKTFFKPFFSHHLLEWWQDTRFGVGELLASGSPRYHTCHYPSLLLY